MPKTMSPKQAMTVRGPKMAGDDVVVGAETRPWYRLHPRSAVEVAVGLFVVVTFLHWFQDGSGQAIVVLYVLPIALLAITFGRRGGLLAAATGFGLFALLEVLHSSGDIDVDGWAVRAIAMFLLGGLLGHATDQALASERAALVEQQRRCQVEAANHRYAQAMEISDSLVQKMVAAKWMAEQGRVDETAEVLTTTIVEAERMVTGLVRKRMVTPSEDLLSPVRLVDETASPPPG